MLEKYRFYVPNLKAEQFIKMVGTGKQFVSLFSAANGVGKTAVGANMLAHMMWPVGSKWFQDPLYTKYPFDVKRGRIVSDPTTIKSHMIPELKSWFPDGRYTTSKASKSWEYTWKTDTGFEFDVMTYDQDVKEFESVTLGWAWFDEPPPEAIYKATVSRMRRGGIIFITATPLTGSAWMYDTILTNSVPGQRDYVEANVEDACITHGVRGHLRHEDIERMVSEYSEEDKQARVHGKFQHLTGLVFKNFNRKVHIVKPFEIDPKDFSTVERLDTHPRVPQAVLWVATRRDGVKFVVDELFIQANTQELSRKIKHKAADYRIVDRRADPAAFVEDQSLGDSAKNSLAKRLDHYGLTYSKASKARTQAIYAIKDALDYQEVNGEMIKRPMLYFFETCQRTIWEMEHWQYHEYTGKSSEWREKSGKPVDKDDHMIENLGRALIDDPGFVEQEHSALNSMVGQTPNFDPFKE